MNINEWTPYYKIDPIENRLVRSNMLYTPLVNPEGTIFCMNWDADHPYQTAHGPRPDFTPELLEFFFEREVTHLKLFNSYKWAPEVIDIDEPNKMIFFKWYGETCNNIVYSDYVRNADSGSEQYSYKDPFSLIQFGDITFFSNGNTFVS